jgi:hypothetical protein
MFSERYTFDDIPDQTGKVALVTGGRFVVGLGCCRIHIPLAHDFLLCVARFMMMILRCCRSYSAGIGAQIVLGLALNGAEGEWPRFSSFPIESILIDDTFL